MKKFTINLLFNILLTTTEEVYIELATHKWREVDSRRAALIYFLVAIVGITYPWHIQTIVGIRNEHKMVNF